MPHEGKVPHKAVQVPHEGHKALHEAGCDYKQGGNRPLLEAYAIENGEVKMSKQELITMIENAGFEAVERDTVYNRVENVVA